MTAKAAAPPAPATTSFDQFLERLYHVADGARIGNALSMLKAERFQLFSEVEKDALVGIVRSQSSAARVYTCRLDSEGNYSCGTQNLRVCGGLRGAVCKHLLVLIIGLAKSGTIDPETVRSWVSASRKRAPKFDKDQASAAFLRYSGAQAGEVDWRPTETIPEDFYAL
jgi:hypothetical protein